FDTKKYLQVQEKAIRKRLNKSEKLYLEFGGKLLFDGHAARVLPGYEPTAKLQLLQKLKQDLEVLVCVSAKELQKGKIHGDVNLNNEEFTLKILGELKVCQLPVTAVVINRFEEEPTALDFERRLKCLGLRVYKRREIPNYPANADFIISPRGYGTDPYIKTSKPIVLVTASGPNSGKLSTCLGQLYYERKHGCLASYAKFETFPVWDLPLKHPVNIAYEAATADLGDFNLIDPFHLKAYGKTAINYNRDVEAFPILEKLFKSIIKTDTHIYRSPTDMGVNCISQGIIDDQLVQKAACQEVIFRFFRYQAEAKKGLKSKKALQRTKALMEELGLKPEDRKVVPVARKALCQAQKQRDKGEGGTYCGAAVELADGQVVTGKNSLLLHAEAAVILNAIKVLAGIPDKTYLLSPKVISGVNKVKQEILKEKSESLNLSETLVALSMVSITNPTVNRALKCLTQLRGCKMHTTHIPARGDESAFRKLNLWVTTDANVPLSKAFFY
ncbi:DUF1846 domain-containing protein, partial [Patescibacteria group bacterium]|nr:DUF1846 domain-containing protein [Patescibacteria group bacterium]